MLKIFLLEMGIMEGGEDYSINLSAELRYGILCVRTGYIIFLSSWFAGLPFS